MHKKQIVIIDDEPNICTSLEFALEEAYDIATFTSPEVGLEHIKNNPVDVALVDLMLGEANGIDVLKDIKRISQQTAVIIMTAFGSTKSTVEAMRSGAYYYLEKPIDITELELLLEQAFNYLNLNETVEHLSAQLHEKYSSHGIIGKSPQIRQIFDIINKIKSIDSSVLIVGESGTGKELVARAIHYQGNRKNERFEAINCAAIPEDLLESELFGYVKGAFSGAAGNKVGKFSIANKGTIFLDEIGEMGMSMQSKLLRVLQEKEFCPLGSNDSETIDVRVIAATNVDIEEAIQNKTFREDLYYRLNVIKIEVPALRERLEDIPLLVRHFIEKYNSRFDKTIQGIDSEALDLLETHRYAGNIRELENIVERAVVLTDSDRITCDDLPKRLGTEVAADKPVESFEGLTLRELEKQAILRTLQACSGNQKKAANILGVTERTIRNKLKIYESEQ